MIKKRIGKLMGPILIILLAVLCIFQTYKNARLEEEKIIFRGIIYVMRIYNTEGRLPENNEIRRILASEEIELYSSLIPDSQKIDFSSPYPRPFSFSYYLFDYSIFDLFVVD